MGSTRDSPTPTQYRAFLENVTDLVSVVDREGRYTYVSPSVEQFADEDRASLLGTDWLSWVHPDDREWLREAFREAVHTPDGELTAEYRCRSADGSWRWLQTTGRNHIDTPDIDGVLAVSRDITAQVEQENRLAALSEATNQLVYERSTDAVGSQVIDIVETHLPDRPAVVWVFDGETELLEPVAFSRAAAELVETHLGEEGPQPLEPGTWEREVFERGDTTAVEDYQSLSNPSHPGLPLGAVVAFPLGSHALLAVASPDGPFEEPDSQFLRVLANTSEGALDRAAREEALEAYKTELERSNENLQEFAYIASHDLQEPLRMVSSYVALLEHEYAGALDDEADEYIAFAVDGAERMKSMIEALLEYSRVHTHAKPFDTVDLDAVLEEVLQALSLVTADTGATITHDPLPTLDCDRDQLGQVLQNLLSNALDHPGDGPPVVHVGVEELPDAYRFSVADEGTGIPERDQEQIFDIFKRGSRTESSEGTGIGLAICERIVERHGGDIWVESTPTEGATFYFTIAKRQRTNTAPDPQPGASGANP